MQNLTEELTKRSPGLISMPIIAFCQSNFVVPLAFIDEGHGAWGMGHGAWKEKFSYLVVRFSHEGLA